MEWIIILCCHLCSKLTLVVLCRILATRVPKKVRLWNHWWHELGKPSSFQKHSKSKTTGVSFARTVPSHSAGNNLAGSGIPQNANSNPFDGFVPYDPSSPFSLPSTSSNPYAPVSPFNGDKQQQQLQQQQQQQLHSKCNVSFHQHFRIVTQRRRLQHPFFLHPCTSRSSCCFFDDCSTNWCASYLCGATTASH